MTIETLLTYSREELGDWTTKHIVYLNAAEPHGATHLFMHILMGGTRVSPELTEAIADIELISRLNPIFGSTPIITD